MANISRRVVAAVMAAALLVPGVSSAQDPAASVTIAVVRDGPAAGPDVAALVEQEISKHLPGGTTVSFKRDPAFDGGWNPARVEIALRRALDDPEVDLVLVTGALATLAALRFVAELPRPVVSAFVQRSDLFQLPGPPRQDLVYTVVPGRAEREVETFRSLVPFTTLHVAVDAFYLAAREDFSTRLPEAGRKLGVELRLVPVAEDAGAVLDALPGDVEAIYLGLLPRLSGSARQALLDALAQRGIPSFSQLGHADVERGALAALTPDFSGQLARRVALNLARLARGAPAAELASAMTVDAVLLINAATAWSVDYVPDQETRLFASFVHPEALGGGAEELDLATAMRMAEERNTSLALQDSVVESARQDAAIARTFLLPQIRADVAHIQTDAPLAIGPAGLAADGATQGALALRQLIYDDPTWSARRAALRLVASSEAEREAVRLDVLGQAGGAFLNMALAQSLFRIELENLRLTEEFLELARLRNEVGYSGRDEILRWEAEAAEQRSAVYVILEGVEAARIALNQLLDVDQSRRWRPAEAPSDVGKFFLAGRLAPLQGRRATFGPVRGRLVDMAVENAPEVRALEQVILAQEIAVGQAKRRYYLPSVFADVTYASDIAEGDDSGLGGLGVGDDSATVTFIASYPIFEGGRKARGVAKAQADLETLNRQLELLEERLEQRTRTAVWQVESSFPRIGLSLRAADSAAQNLEIVQDQYAEGIVNVTDLLSAQFQKFTADQLATIALYEYLLDVVELQRALSWFEVDKSAAEKEAFIERVMAAAEGE